MFIIVIVMGRRLLTLNPWQTSLQRLPSRPWELFYNIACSPILGISTSHQQGFHTDTVHLSPDQPPLLPIPISIAPHNHSMPLRTLRSTRVLRPRPMTQ